MVVGTFFQLSGATLEIFLLLSTKKNSLSEDRSEKQLKHSKLCVHFFLFLKTVFTINIGKTKIEMLHQVRVSNNHVKDISSSGFHLTLDQNALTIWHHHVQLSLTAGRLPLF